jgi:hypothetical protein
VGSKPPSTTHLSSTPITTSTHPPPNQIDGNFDDPRLTDYDLLLSNLAELRAGRPAEVCCVCVCVCVFGGWEVVSSLRHLRGGLLIGWSNFNTPQPSSHQTSRVLSPPRRTPPPPKKQTPIYDFKQSRRSGHQTLPVPASRIVVIEGIYALSDRLRPLLDLRVSITGGVHFDLVKRVMRDISRSGQGPEEIIQQVGGGGWGCDQGVGSARLTGPTCASSAPLPPHSSNPLPLRPLPHPYNPPPPHPKTDHRHRVPDVQGLHRARPEEGAAEDLQLVQPLCRWVGGAHVLGCLLRHECGAGRFFFLIGPKP